MSHYKLLSTKKLDPLLKEEAGKKGIEVLEEEFIEIRPIYTKEKHEEVLQWITHPEPLAIAFTSQHAVNNAMMHLHSNDVYYVPTQWVLFCLGGATLDAVNENGFGNQVAGTAPNAAELAKKIIANGTFKQVVFFCGNKRREELPALLKENGINVQEVTVYETIETPVITTQDIDVILFFSPSAVKSFFYVNTLSPKTACIAIGATTAEAISAYTNNRVITSEQPTQEMMLASAWLYLQNINCYE